MKKKLGQITNSLGLIENYYKELNKTNQLKKMVEQLHQELYTLCINYPNECELQENQELKRRIDEQISALKFPDPDEDLNVKLYTTKLYDKFISLVDKLDKDKDKEFYEKHRIDSIKNRFNFFI